LLPWFLPATTSEGVGPIRRYIPELDGLRAFAIAAVLLVHSNFHFGIPALDAMQKRGWIGVDLFFVISGYLITSILLRTRDSEHYFRNFYARRGLRIWPLYYLLLLYVFVLTPHLGAWAHQDFDPQVNRWPYYLFYVQNLIYSRLGSFALVITWSLCVEEQFYMVWPLIVRLCNRRVLTGVAVAVLLMGTPFRMYLHHIHAIKGFFFTLTRLDPIAVGALVAIQPKWFKHTWIAAPWAFWLLKTGDFEFVYFAMALTFGSVVMHLVTNSNRFFRMAPLRFVGRVSYGMYIYHPIIFGLYWLTPLYKWTGHLPLAEPIRMIGQCLLPIPIAALSWYLFEKPVLKLKRFFEAQESPKKVEEPVGGLVAQAAD
jgi:peptidoglycan/LPS O-acetylase OafA/YrhL